ncbi:DUF4886 domain-containing protein [Cerasicoccus fimbriatus]|uniref:DUF4886 domain-containing protein n=1 Tax=Cerasicoccus fimbriatus TaxID=3014554 RepID=UPI0022B53EE0|nr:DUF4886 domain-containing protein [Cerasicoccus sp. TK19100]
MKHVLTNLRINNRTLAAIAALSLAVLVTPLAADKITGLFVGNSYCDYNALNKQVEAMLIASGDEALLKRETKGGFSWKKHWEGPKAQKRITDEEEWDFVVLQNHSRSSLDKRAEFDEYGEKLIALVKESGSEPVLYMTWARANLPQDQAVITEAYSSLGKREGVKVAPVGIAFENWINAHPNVALHIQDNSHPTMEGSYLAACVIYATITGKSPVGLPNIIEGANWVTKGNHLAFLDPTLAKQLQETAWSTVQAYSPEAYFSETPLEPSAAPDATTSTNNYQPKDTDIRINFGGQTPQGWNKVGGNLSPAPIPLVSANGQSTTSTIEVVDAFQDYENEGVVKIPLAGDAIAFDGAKNATLFLNRGENNPTGEVRLTLDPAKAYNIQVWASRHGNGRRWAKYTITGEQTQSQFLAGGSESGADGNFDKVLHFANVKPSADGTVSLKVEFPAEGDPVRNIGDYIYLTGMIVSPQ